MSKAHHGRKPRLVMTSAGEVRLSRVYFRCVRCRSGGFVLDERLGVQGRYSPHAERLMCLAAGSWSYDLSSERLEELCGLSISDTAIRDHAQQRGAEMLEWQRSHSDAVSEFREAPGEVEFTSDGTCVNTTEGWREMKVGLFSKREPGDPATTEEWADRELPKPNASVAFAAIEASEDFGRRWKAWRKRLGLHEASITVLADGAKWIWEEQRKHLIGAEGVLDIFHALEHVAATAKVLHQTPAEIEAWTTAARTVLLEQGWSGIETLIRERRATTQTTASQAALDDLWNYLGSHQDHLHYRQRLANGQSIGSGQIEGACKNLIGRRLKANASRWRIRRVNRMAGLCCLMYSHQWNAYWNTLAT
jgi:hypothetical protein